MNRKLLLGLALALAGATALIMLILASAEGDVSLTGPALGRPAPETAQGVPLLPVPAGDEASELTALDGEPGETGGVGGAASADKGALRGRVTGRVVDPAGLPVVGEPVWLTLDQDRWEPDVRDERLPRVMARAITGTDGAFSLTARAGADHELHAGGSRWPGVRRDDVHAGDELLLALPQAERLDGLVVDAETGRAIEGARIVVVQDAGSILVDGRPDGSFAVAPLPPEDVVVGAWAPGYEARVSGNVAPGLGPVTLELAPGRTLKGKLVDRFTEQPLHGGKVRLLMSAEAALAGGDPIPLSTLVHEREVEVGDDGRFVFEGASSMGFDLVCTSDGYLPERYDRFKLRTLDAGEEIVIQLHAAGELAGRAVIADTGKPAEGALLALTAADGQLATAVADAQGDFVLRALDAPVEALLVRPLFVTAHAPGLAARARPMRNRDELLLQLVPVLPLSVIVLDGGAPAPGAEVAVRSAGALTAQAVADAHGLASLVHELSGPDSDRVVVQARRGDVESLPFEVDPREQPNGPITIDLQEGGWLEGLVTDRAGLPLPSALVAARPTARESTDPRRSGRSAADGRFRVGPLPPQVEYRLEVSAEGFLETELKSVFAGAGELNVQLVPVVAWRGRALAAPGGAPMRDFWGQLLVETKDSRGNVRQRNTGERMRLVAGDPGGFAFDLPAPGRYLVKLFARDTVPGASDPVDFDGAFAPPFTTLMLSSAAVLEVTVLDGRGRPVPGYSVAAAPWELAQKAASPNGDVRKKSITARTDDNGLVRLNLGAGGTYRIGGGPGLWFDDGAVTVPPGPPLQRLYRLPPTADLEVTVHDELGRPLAGATVEVRSSDSEKVHSVNRRTRSGQDNGGIVRMDSLPPGDYDVTARRRNYLTVRASLHLVDGLEHLTLVLEPRPQEPGNQGPGGGGQGGGGQQWGGQGGPGGQGGAWGGGPPR